MIRDDPTHPDVRESHHSFIAKWKLDTLSVKFLQDAQRLLADVYHVHNPNSSSLPSINQSF